MLESETMIWKKTERSRIRTVQRDNLRALVLKLEELEARDKNLGGP